jgi:hypothetical protein
MTLIKKLIICNDLFAGSAIIELEQSYLLDAKDTCSYGEPRNIFYQQKHSFDATLTVSMHLALIQQQ